MFKAKIAAVALFALALSACGPRPELPQQQFENPAQEAPVPQAQAQDEGYGAGTVAAAAIGGALVGNMMSNSGSRERTVVIDNRRPNYGYGSYNKGYGKKTTTTTTTVKKSLFGGKKTITRTTTKRRR